MDKEKKYNIQDIDIQACSTMDCTGLIPAKPSSEEELENYDELYPYLAKAIPADEETSEKNS